MNRLTAGVGQSVSIINAHMPAKMQSMPQLVQRIFLGQLAFYGFYNLVSGPTQMKLKRYFTVTPESGMQSLATFHMCHTSTMPLLLNLGVLGTLGSYVCRTQGANSFLRLMGLSFAAASVAVAIDARNNPNQTQAGSIASSSALLAYTTFAHPEFYALLRLSPLTFTAAALGYGIYYNDQACVGGLAAGYAAFCFAL